MEVFLEARSHTTTTTPLALPLPNNGTTDGPCQATKRYLLYYGTSRYPSTPCGLARPTRNWPLPDVRLGGGIGELAVSMVEFMLTVETSSF